MLGVELSTRENLYYFKLPHEYRKSRMPTFEGASLEPDAFLGVMHNDKVFKVAIEIELTQKSSERVYEKFNQYKDSSYFDYVIYFFRDKSILEAYRRRLKELMMELKDDNSRAKLSGKILFLYSSQNHHYAPVLENSTMECFGKELSIEKFFGHQYKNLDLKKLPKTNQEEQWKLQ